MGLVSADLAALVVKELQLPITAEEYLAEVGPVNVRLFPSANLMPGTCMTRTSSNSSQTHRTVRVRDILERDPFPFIRFFFIFLISSVLFLFQCLSLTSYQLIFPFVFMHSAPDCFIPPDFIIFLYDQQVPSVCCATCTRKECTSQLPRAAAAKISN